MQLLQEIIERKYSRKLNKDVVRAEVDVEHKAIHAMIDAIDTYRYGEYTYKSKVERVGKLALPSEILAEEIAVLVLGAKPMSPVQSLMAQMVNLLPEYSDILDALKTSVELLAVCEGELYTLHHASSEVNETDTLAIEAKYSLSAACKEHVSNTKYLPPMIFNPIPWTNNNNGGNFLGSGSVILGSINQHDKKQSLDVINILQDIAWELDENILEYDEESKKALDTHDKEVSFNHFKSASEEVYSDLLEAGNKFYFVWKYDFRGRSYSQGYHVNLQSNSYRKALLNFNTKVKITDDIIV